MNGAGSNIRCPFCGSPVSGLPFSAAGRRSYSFASFLLALALSGGARCAAAAPPGSPAAAFLAGEAVVSEDDISGWQAAQACYGEGAITSRRAAFMRLLEAAIAEKALKSAGALKDAAGEARAEAARIDRETRAPGILECVKRVLGPGDARYLRVFVRPALIESRTRFFLRQTPQLQAGPRKRAGECLAGIAKGEQMRDAAARLGLLYSTAAYSAESSTAARGSSDRFMTRPLDGEMFEKELKGLEPGELKTEMIETENAFSVARRLPDDGGARVFELATMRKTGQREWFASMRKMKLEVADERLRLWLKSIKGNPRLAAVELK